MALSLFLLYYFHRRRRRLHQLIGLGKGVDFFATFPVYIPSLCRGTLGTLSKMLNVNICEVGLTWFHVTFRRYIAKEKELMN